MMWLEQLRQRDVDTARRAERQHIGAHQDAGVRVPLDDGEESHQRSRRPRDVRPAAPLECDLGEVLPHDVQRTAADDGAVLGLDHEELLHRLVERHQVLFQQDLAGVDVDERLHRWDVGRAGTPDEKPLGRSVHTCEGIGCDF